MSYSSVLCSLDFRSRWRLTSPSARFQSVRDQHQACECVCPPNEKKHKFQKQHQERRNFQSTLLKTNQVSVWKLLPYFYYTISYVCMASWTLSSLYSLHLLKPFWIFCRCSTRCSGARFRTFEMYSSASLSISPFFSAHVGQHNANVSNNTKLYWRWQLSFHICTTYNKH